jgi:hypothetical protein
MANSIIVPFILNIVQIFNLARARARLYKYLQFKFKTDNKSDNLKWLTILRGFRHFYKRRNTATHVKTWELRQHVTAVRHSSDVDELLWSLKLVARCRSVSCALFTASLWGEVDDLHAVSHIRRLLSVSRGTTMRIPRKEKRNSWNGCTTSPLPAVYSPRPTFLRRRVYNKFSSEFLTIFSSQ